MTVNRVDRGNGGREAWGREGGKEGGREGRREGGEEEGEGERGGKGESRVREGLKNQM